MTEGCGVGSLLRGPERGSGCVAAVPMEVSDCSEGQTT